MGSGTKKITILGTGGWGTALGVLLAGNGHHAALWGRSPEYVEEVRRGRENRKYLPGVRIPESVELASGAPPAADLIILAVPTQHIRATIGGLNLNAETPILSVAKGIEMKTEKRPTEIVREVVGRARVAVLSGPSHAEEVGRGLPATVTAAAKDEELARFVQKLLMGSTFRVYTSSDVVGVELGGALKNIIAIAAGLCDGLQLGDNAKAALLSRGIVEMSRLGVALGARQQTFFGVSGIGDLITTCYSPHGRNLHVGREIGRGRTLEEVLAGMTMVAEGVWTCKAARAIAREKGLSMPITEEVCRILHEGKPAREAVRHLMERKPKAEAEDWL